jgi:hypothetical protein
MFRGGVFISSRTIAGSVFTSTTVPLPDRAQLVWRLVFAARGTIHFADNSAIAENTACFLFLCLSYLSFSLARSLLLRSSVTLKIEAISGEQGASIKLIGRLRAESLPDLEAEIKASARLIALEMDEVTLVDLDVVRFLGVCESQGIEIRGCPPYIRQWIAQEKESGNP